jgi:16S rRNA (guanine966-N2)-methyltransferase
MRIIAGLYRGRTLQTLPGLELRPTPSRLRETLFDVLGRSVEGSVFVDAYAGSGAVGIEALSRGAGHLAFIEENAARVRVIRRNLVSLGIRENVEIIGSLVRRGLRSLSEAGLRANFVFADPPYDAEREYARLLHWIGERELLAADGLVIVQHSRREVLEEEAGQLLRVRLLTQGSNALSFFRPVEIG